MTLSFNNSNNNKPLLSLQETVKRYGITPKKSLGQNFLLDSFISEQIISHLPSLANKIIVEIGPGPGGLTRAILSKNPLKLYAIEIDERAIKALEELKAIYTNLEVINADGLTLNMHNFASDDIKIQIIANLPYNISTQLIIKWLEQRSCIDSITVMLQKEVAIRAAAEPGSKLFGRFGALCQIFADVEVLFEVPPEFFYPPPKVDSSVVHFKIKQDRLSLNIGKLQKLLSTLFSSKRKMLKQLKIDLGDIDPSLRAEQLSIDQILTIWHEICKR